MSNKLLLTVGSLLLSTGAVVAAEVGRPPPMSWADIARLTLFIVLLSLPPLAALLALLTAYRATRYVRACDAGTDQAQELAAAVQQGAQAHLRAQFRRVLIVMALMLVILFIFSLCKLQSMWLPLCFATGVLCSALCGWRGMTLAALASARAARATEQSLSRGVQVAVRAGAVTGLFVVGVGLLAIWSWYMLLHYVLLRSGDLRDVALALLGLAFGATLQALFARVGGGIYATAATAGAGTGAPELPAHDPRHPAAIACQVGGYAGAVAGHGADLYESYCGAILCTVVLGALLSTTVPGGEKAAFCGDEAVLTPMVVAAVGIILAIVGLWRVRSREKTSPAALHKALNRGRYFGAVLLLAAAAGLALLKFCPWGIFGALAAGVVGGLGLGHAPRGSVTDAPAPATAAPGTSGPPAGIFDGLAGGIFSAGFPVLVVCGTMLVAFGVAAGGFVTDLVGQRFALGLYGMALAAVGLLASLGLRLATDVYGPIASHAAGNAATAGLPPEVQEKLAALGTSGCTRTAMGKGFALGAAALTTLAFVATYIQGADYLAFRLGLDGAKIRGDVSVSGPLAIAGLFLGALLAFVFVAFVLRAVGRAAGSLATEVRRQLKDVPGLADGQAKPDYAPCVTLTTKAVQRELRTPALLAAAVALATGLILGIPGTLGLLIGSLATGFTLACLLNRAGAAVGHAASPVAAPDAREAGAPAAALGAACQDAAGPALNSLLKLLCVLCLVFAPLVVRFAPAIQGLIFRIK